tara:strand:+ start:52 stop:282 length:231 start_codon:yes stop_codon:yes gene_type:complete
MTKSEIKKLQRIDANYWKSLDKEMSRAMEESEDWAKDKKYIKAKDKWWSVHQVLKALNVKENFDMMFEDMNKRLGR